ncbi:MAG: hypothetical protein CVV23_14535 [Ignavibacteriae bacterium HGW-Ignavibacteriae-2]|nr:MAG: hypothetical protein CVV23_14535 [Ignavibacteriae bacterium HGW-Ignavibacteriae-2]
MINKASLFFILTFFVWLLPLRLSMDDFSGVPDNPFPLSKKAKQWVEETLAGMSVKDKCAQMIFSNTGNLDTNMGSKSFKRLEKLVRDFHVGGLIFFQTNVYDQILITNYLQSISSVPLLISSDYELGPGMRLRDVVQFPHNMALGAANDTKLTYLTGKYSAELGRLVGVQLNYAPLLDVNNDYRNPVINIRAYSDDPKLISWHGNSFIKGMLDGRMISTAKHFPGHGATDLDSHLQLPLINTSKADLEKIDIVPFREAINSGVQAVMIGHLLVPALENRNGLPATLSPSIITDYLKDKLNFGGLVITDAMNMKAITDSFTTEEASKLAVMAGNDILLFPPNDSLAIEGIYKAVLKGEISENRINESVRKILSAKKWLHLDVIKKVDYKNAVVPINNPSYRRLALQVAEQSITLLKDNKNIIPLNPKSYYETVSISLSGSRNNLSADQSRHIEDLIEKKLGYVKTYRLNLSSNSKNYSKVFETARNADLIILNLFLTKYYAEDSTFIDKEQKSFITSLIKLKKPLVVLNFGNPYLFKDISEVGTYLCSYSHTKVSQEAMFNAITGKSEIRGKLPVSIPFTNFKIGDGLKKQIKLLTVPEMISDSNYNFSQIDTLMARAVKDSVFPGSVLLIGHNKKIVYHKAFGSFTYDKKSRKMDTDAIFDLASITKAAGTTSAAMLLYDLGKLDLDKTVSSILPNFKGGGKEKIIIKHLLTHNSGLPAYKEYYKMYKTRDQIIDDLMKTNLIFEPGADYTYSDLGMITLQLVIEKIIGQPVDKFLKDNLFLPLTMTNTMYNPPPQKWFYCVPTEVDNYWRQTTLKGKVHDETAYMLGGVSGHAGLFSTASDLAKLLFVYVNNGKWNNKLIFKPETIDLFTRVHSKFGERGYGWDIKSNDDFSSAGQKFSSSAFGHTGFTGTSIWVDEKKDLFVILLTNRVYPTRDNKKIILFRPQLHNSIVDAISYD